MISHLFGIMFILWLGYFWWSAMQARETALAAARAYCQKMQITLLDECVALTAAWLKRDQAGKWRPWRAYSFEFTVSGYERYQGKIILLGQRIEQITTEPYRIFNDTDAGD